jgi:hypothetical protein
MVKQSKQPETVQSKDGGSNPTPSLQNLMWIRPCTSMGDVREFVEKHHYSHSVQGITPFLSFEIVRKEDHQQQIGAAIFGAPGQTQTEQKYGEYAGSKQEWRPKYVAVELRRFVLIDELPKNSESWLLSRLLQKLTHLGVDRIISYADPNQQREEHPDGKHTGLIYRAMGFHKVKAAGKTKAIMMLKDYTEDRKTFKKGRRLPIRNIDQYQNFRVKDKSSLDPKIKIDWETAKRKDKAVVWTERSTGRSVYVIKTEEYLTSLSKRLRNALKVGAAQFESEEGKILYIKDLRTGMPYFETPTKED